MTHQGRRMSHQGTVMSHQGECPNQVPQSVGIRQEWTSNHTVKVKHHSNAPTLLLTQVDLLNEDLDLGTQPGTQALQPGARLQAMQLMPGLSVVISCAGQIGESGGYRPESGRGAGRW